MSLYVIFVGPTLVATVIDVFSGCSQTSWFTHIPKLSQAMAEVKKNIEICSSIFRYFTFRTISADVAVFFGPLP